MYLDLKLKQNKKTFGTKEGRGNLLFLTRKGKNNLRKGKITYNPPKKNLFFYFFSIPNPSIRLIFLWLLHYVFFFSFPLLMFVYPGSWGGSRIDSVAIFIRGGETDAPQTDRLADRSEVVCTINCWKQKQRFFKQAATPLWFICIFMRAKTFFFYYYYCFSVVCRRGFGRFAKVICFLWHPVKFSIILF